MIRDDNGKRMIGVWPGNGADEKRPKTTWATPERISPNQVYKKLCSEGPQKCPECGLCAFGRWVVAHERESVRVNEKPARGALKRDYEERGKMAI